MFRRARRVMHGGEFFAPSACSRQAERLEREEIALMLLFQGKETDYIGF